MAPRGRWFRYGCLGCLGFVGLALVLVVVVSGVAWITAEPEQTETRVLTPELPLAGTSGPLPGRVTLEIRDAEFHLEAAAPGEPLRVEARYDANAFVLEGELDAGPGDGGEWAYRMTFGKGGLPGAFSGLVSLVRGSTARIEVFLPADLPIDLVLNVSGGSAVARLGGLWLHTAEIELAAAAIDLSVDEPLRVPMEKLTIRSTAGGALLNRLGNASPRRLSVSYSAGGIDMDLSGRWSRDADIEITGGVGGGMVHLPWNVIIEGLDHREPGSPLDPESSTPTLRFSVSTQIGKLEFSD